MSVVLEGNIAYLSLFNLLQLVKLEQKTCRMTVSIKELHQEAKLYFKHGIIKHAELNKLVGRDAVYRLICWWNKGDFNIDEIDPSDIPAETIPIPLESILIECAKRTDDLADLRNLVPTLDDKMSFTDIATYEIQNNFNPDEPDWIPGFVMELPITFTLARYFDVCAMNDLESCNSLRYMFSVNILTPHTNEENVTVNLDSAIESLSSIVMEYLGFSQSQKIIKEACEALQITQGVKPGFAQLLAFSDFIKARISDILDEDIAQEVEWRLRARITSLA